MRGAGAWRVWRLRTKCEESGGSGPCPDVCSSHCRCLLVSKGRLGQGMAVRIGLVDSRVACYVCGCRYVFVNTDRDGWLHRGKRHAVVMKPSVERIDELEDLKEVRGMMQSQMTVGMVSELNGGSRADMSAICMLVDACSSICTGWRHMLHWDE